MYEDGWMEIIPYCQSQGSLMPVSLEIWAAWVGVKTLGFLLSCRDLLPCHKWHCYSGIRFSWLLDIHLLALLGQIPYLHLTAGSSFPGQAGLGLGGITILNRLIKSDQLSKKAFHYIYSPGNPHDQQSSSIIFNLTINTFYHLFLFYMDGMPNSSQAMADSMLFLFLPL